MYISLGVINQGRKPSLRDAAQKHVVTLIGFGAWKQYVESAGQFCMILGGGMEQSAKVLLTRHLRSRGFCDMWKQRSQNFDDQLFGFPATRQCHSQSIEDKLVETHKRVC